jgi:hypothetical protein
VRDNPSLNSIWFKGVDYEGKPCKMDINKMNIVLKRTNEEIRIKNIPDVSHIYDTEHTSSFEINNKKLSREKSINVHKVLFKCSEVSGKEAPYVILDYLDRIRLENVDKEELFKEITRIEMAHRDYIPICDNKTDYKNYIESQFEKAFGMLDLSEVKVVKQIIGKVVNQSWSLTKIERNIQELAVYEIDHKNATIEELKKIMRLKAREIKEIVKADYRKFDYNEYTILLESGVSNNKLKLLYGQKKEILQKTENLEIVKL